MNEQRLFVLQCILSDISVIAVDNLLLISCTIYNLLRDVWKLVKGKGEKGRGSLKFFSHCLVWMKEEQEYERKNYFPN